MILLSKCKWLEAILGAKKADGLQPKQPLSLSAAASEDLIRILMWGRCLQTADWVGEGAPFPVSRPLAPWGAESVTSALPFCLARGSVTETNLDEGKIVERERPSAFLIWLFDFSKQRSLRLVDCLPSLSVDGRSPCHSSDWSVSILEKKSPRHFSHNPCSVLAFLTALYVNHRKPLSCWEPGTGLCMEGESGLVEGWWHLCYWVTNSTRSLI